MIAQLGRGNDGPILGFIRCVVLAIGLAVLVTSCSSNGAQQGQSPIAEYLGWEGGQDFVEAAALNDARLVETNIGTCMAANGFEYRQRAISVELVVGTRVGADLNPEDYATTFGFAMSTTFEDILYKSSIELPVAGEDPNAPLLSAMSSTEREAWFTTLNGEAPLLDEETGQLVDPQTGVPIEDPSVYLGQGCVGEARAAAQSTQQPLVDLGPELADIERRIESDPRTVEMANEWQACMSRDGYSFESVAQMQEVMLQEFFPLRNRILRAVQQPRKDGETIDLSSDQPQFDPIPDALAEELADLEVREIATAVSSYQCDNGNEGARQTIRNEYEQQFVDANRLQLDELATVEN